MQSQAFTARSATGTYSLPADPTSARVARRLIREALFDFDAPVVDTAELLISELIANAVSHAGSAPEIRIEVDSACVLVAVQDHSSTTPALQRATDDASSGRGLLIVDTLARAWGWSMTGEGKRVWFRL